MTHVPPNTNLTLGMVWRPILDEATRLTYQNTSAKSVRSALTAAFGAFPIRLTQHQHGAALKAMHAVAEAMNNAGTPYKSIIDGLDKFGAIEVIEA